MKVFRQDQRMTDLGLRLSGDIETALKDVWDSYILQGVNIRDLAAMTHLVVHEVETEMILNLTQDT